MADGPWNDYPAQQEDNKKPWEMQSYQTGPPASPESQDPLAKPPAKMPVSATPLQGQQTPTGLDTSKSTMMAGSGSQEPHANQQREQLGIAGYDAQAPARHEAAKQTTIGEMSMVPGAEEIVGGAPIIRAMAPLAKRVVAGGLTGGGLYAAQKGIRGEMPDLKGTAEATGVGMVAGPVLDYAGPKIFSHINKPDALESRIPFEWRGPQSRGGTIDEAQGLMNQEMDARHEDFAKNLAAIEKSRQQELAAAERLKEQHAAALNRRGEPLAEGTGLDLSNSTLSEQGSSGNGRRPSPSEREATNLVRKDILTPQEYEKEKLLLGDKAARQPGEGRINRQGRLLGHIRSRRGGVGMLEPR